MNCLIKRCIPFVLQLVLLCWGANTEDLHLGGDNVSACEICFLSDFSGPVLMAGEQASLYTWSRESKETEQENTEKLFQSLI